MIILKQRKKTINQLDEILLRERDKIIEGGIWNPTEETRKAEKWLDMIYLEIASGSVKWTVQDFEKGCIFWRQSGQMGDLREGIID